MTHSDDGVVIPGGRLRPPRWRHLVPIARFLVEERGHLPIHNPERWGFAGMGVFWFTRRITQEDWEALNRHFVLPSNIWFHKGLIRDGENGVDFMGVDEILESDGSQPAEVWEAKERALDRTYGRPDLGEGKAGPPLR